MNYPVFYRYVAIFTYSKDGVHITFPDLPGCVSYGETEDEAMKNARKSLALHMFGIERDQENIPKPSSIKDLTDTEKLGNNETFVQIETFLPILPEKRNKKFAK